MEKLTGKLAIEVEQKKDGTWIGYTYRKIGNKWHISGVISPRDTQDKARKATIALAK